MSDEATARMDAWRQRCADEYAAEVARGEHDDECEYDVRGFHLCHCAKRRREAEGITDPPGELIHQHPICPRCDAEVSHDGESFYCEPCSASWPNVGELSGAAGGGGGHRSAAFGVEGEPLGLVRGKVVAVVATTTATRSTLGGDRWRRYSDDERRVARERIASLHPDPPTPSGGDETGGLMERLRSAAVPLHHLTALTAAALDDLAGLDDAPDDAPILEGSTVTVGQVVTAAEHVTALLDAAQAADDPVRVPDAGGRPMTSTPDHDGHTIDLSDWHSFKPGEPGCTRCGLDGDDGPCRPRNDGPDPPTPSGGDETGDEVDTTILRRLADCYTPVGKWQSYAHSAADEIDRLRTEVAALRATDGDDEWVQVGWGGPSWDDALEVDSEDDVYDLGTDERIVREGGDAWVVDFGDWHLVHEDGSNTLVEPWPIYARRPDVPGEALRESDRG